MKFPVQTSPHVEANQDVARVMDQVIIALLPGTLVAIWFMGWGVLFNVGLAVLTALVVEAVMLWLRARPIRPALNDHSAIVLAWILALCLPNLAPWWLSVVGSLMAVMVAKQLYGGIGFNLFNPAMVGYVILLVSFPEMMTRWGVGIAPYADQLTLTQTAAWMFAGQLPAGMMIDGLTKATPLDAVRTELAVNGHIGSVTASIFDPSVSWNLWLNLAFLAGGIWLLITRTIRWHIPVATIAGVVITSGFLWLIDPSRFADPGFHLLAGAVIFGAFFVATDPVTSSTTPVGRLVFGFGVGMFAVLIRAFGNYPDGVAFAILLMNMAVPLIDYYTQPRAFGHKKRG
ncbi:MAG TPA: RnfABCDGE type electron transport complex subunit D [Halothiobacillaceae bacterium]|nr:RnfABCDGE type electron transport complex subunit D [Halothiobacillaceae bacterium]